ncbi:MAG: LPS translocon maturation chaperone LptM [Colwellia sp.]
MFKSQSFYFPLKMLFLVTILSGCGIRGDLYLPKETPSSSDTVVDSTVTTTPSQPNNNNEQESIEPKEQSMPVEKEKNVS